MTLRKKVTLHGADSERASRVTRKTQESNREVLLSVCFKK